MKMTAPAILALALAAACGGPTLAQTMSPPVTMQPIPNPPEKAKAHGHKTKHVKKAPAAPEAK